MKKLLLIPILIFALFGNGCGTLYKETMKEKYTEFDIKTPRKLDRGIALLDFAVTISGIIYAPLVAIGIFSFLFDFESGAIFQEKK